MALRVNDNFPEGISDAETGVDLLGSLIAIPLEDKYYILLIVPFDESGHDHIYIDPRFDYQIPYFTAPLIVQKVIRKKIEFFCEKYKMKLTWFPEVGPYEGKLRDDFFRSLKNRERESSDEKGI